MAAVSPASMDCPCGRTGSGGRALLLADCCGRWIDAGALPPDAQALMRSRYTAFVLGRAEYLLATWHPSRRPADLQLEPGARWLGLEVRWQKQQDATHAEVEFVARQRDRSGRAVRLHELSRFILEDGQWFYVDGDALR
jgi:SEC-C motif-containing protein